MKNVNTNLICGIRQTSLTLQQRLSQLKGAKVTTLINPFGIVDGYKIVRVLKSVIVVVDYKGDSYFLSPLGLQIMTINRKAPFASRKKYNIALNSIAREARPNGATSLSNQRIVQIGKDFIEITTNGNTIRLIPLSNVTIIWS